VRCTFAECSSRTSEVWKVDKVAGRQQVVVVGGVANIAPHLNQHCGPKFGMGGRGPWPLTRADWVAGCSLTRITGMIGHDPSVSATGLGVPSYPQGYLICALSTRYNSFIKNMQFCTTSPHTSLLVSRHMPYSPFNTLLALEKTSCIVQKDFINSLSRPPFHNVNPA
jgi:hypothetical protein